MIHNCEICHSTFTRKSGLTAHYKTKKNINKMKKILSVLQQLISIAKFLII